MILARFGLLLGLLAALHAWSALASEPEYALRDGDTVVFLGDSITAAGTYAKIVENYTLLRFPRRQVSFINAGHGGETAAGAVQRLDRDVFGRQATVLIVAYGVNDIGWGVHADEEHKQAYLDAIGKIVRACNEHGVRVYICSAAVTGADPATSQDGFLAKMCDEGRALSDSLGGESIDVQATMRDIQRKVWEANSRVTDEKQKTSLHVADGVHLSDLGQLAMAYAILKGLGAPALVSEASVDVGESTSVAATGCEVTGLKTSDAVVEFDRLDEGLPINFGLFGALSFRFVPIPDELNRYLLTVRGLSAGRYELQVDHRRLGTFTHDQLAATLNIASTTADAWEPGGPWDAQATVVQRLTDARRELALSRILGQAYLPEDPRDADLARAAAELDERLVQLQRAAAAPARYHFVLRRVEEK